LKFLIYTVKSSREEDISKYIFENISLFEKENIEFLLIANGVELSQEEKSLINYSSFKIKKFQKKLSLIKAIDYVFKYFSNSSFSYITRLDPSDHLDIIKLKTFLNKKNEDLILIDYIIFSQSKGIKVDLNYISMVFNDNKKYLYSEPHGAGTVLSRNFVKKLMPYPIHMERNDGYWIFLNSSLIKITSNPEIKYFYNRKDNTLSSSRNSIIESRLTALQELSKKLKFNNRKFYVVMIIRKNSLSDYLINNNIFPKWIKKENKELVIKDPSDNFPKLVLRIITDSEKVSKEIIGATYIKDLKLIETAELIHKIFQGKIIVYYNIEYLFSSLTDIYLALIPLLINKIANSSILTQEESSIISKSQLLLPPEQVRKNTLYQVQKLRQSGLMALRIPSEIEQRNIQFRNSTLLQDNYILGIGTELGELRIKSKEMLESLFKLIRNK